MGQESLSMLMLVSTEHELDFTGIIEEFAFAKANKTGNRPINLRSSIISESERSITVYRHVYTKLICFCLFYKCK